MNVKYLITDGDMVFATGSCQADCVEHLVVPEWAQVIVDNDLDVSNPPSKWHRWSLSRGAWVDTSTTADIKAEKMAALKASRDLALATFTWDGSSFDADTEAKINITGAINRLTRKGEGARVMWRLADNTWRSLNLEQMQQVLEALEDNVEHCFQRFAELEAQVMDPEVTPEQLATLQWQSSVTTE